MLNKDVNETKKMSELTTVAPILFGYVKPKISGTGIVKVGERTKEETSIKLEIFHKLRNACILVV